MGEIRGSRNEIYYKGRMIPTWSFMFVNKGWSLVGLKCEHNHPELHLICEQERVGFVFILVELIDIVDITQEWNFTWIAL